MNFILIIAADILVGVAAYHIGKSNAELKVMQKIGRYIDDINPLDPDRVKVKQQIATARALLDITND